jgi:hydroxyquinol 1,2-dioxygenase
MRHIDADTITQAVIARYAAAGDARLRELMTSLVQHLHAFARDVRLSEAEWAEGLRFLADSGRDAARGRPELALLSDSLGLTALVAAVNQRKPKGCTEATLTVPCPVDGAPHRAGEGPGEACYVRGRVQALDGTPIAGAEVRVGPPGGDGRAAVSVSDADGRFVLKTALAAPQPVVHDGPVGRLLHALGGPPWRPAHLHFTISAPGCERLVTQLFRRGDPYLDADAVFGVRSSLVTDWVRHEPGRTPDGRSSAQPFTTLDYSFVLDNTTGGDKT